MEKNYHHGDLKQELIRIGLEVLESGDYDSLSLRELAAKAGVSKTAPYRHFADKNALLGAITTQGFRLFTAELQEIRTQAGHGGWDVLDRMCRVYMNFAVRRPHLFHLMFSSLGRSFDSPECAQEGMRSLDELRLAIAAWKKNIQQEELEALTIGVWGYIHGLTSLVLEGFIEREEWEGRLGDYLRAHIPGL